MSDMITLSNHHLEMVFTPPPIVTFMLEKRLGQELMKSGPKNPDKYDLLEANLEELDGWVV
jgi:hypothetical protein